MPPKRTKEVTSPVRDKKLKGSGQDGRSSQGGQDGQGGQGGGTGNNRSGRSGSGSGASPPISVSHAEMRDLIRQAYEEGVRDGRQAMGLDNSQDSDEEMHLCGRPRLTPRTPQSRHGDQESGSN